MFKSYFSGLISICKNNISKFLPQLCLPACLPFWAASICAISVFISGLQCFVCVEHKLQISPNKMIPSAAAKRMNATARRIIGSSLHQRPPSAGWRDERADKTETVMHFGLETVSVFGGLVDIKQDMVVGSLCPLEREPTSWRSSRLPYPTRRSCKQVKERHHLTS